MVEPPSTPTPSKDAAVFQRFRARYPAGSLNSELVMVQEQAFVVRVNLQLEEQVCVTALAADQTLEIAEDRARQRAFDLLGLPANPTPLTLQADPQAKATKAVEPPKTKAKPIVSSPTVPVIDVDAEPDLPPEEAELTAPLDLIPDPGAPTESSALPLASSSKPAIPVETSVPTPMHQGGAVTASLPIPAPIDLSDVIAQTDVELKRLAWSVKDGRDYLEQTYNKRSRHDLTDEELLAFLLHLESLPTPVTP